MGSIEGLQKHHGKDGYIFSEETFQTIKELGGILQKIHNRMIKEGYRIEDGVLYGPDGNVEYRKPK